MSIDQLEAVICKIGIVRSRINQAFLMDESLNMTKVKLCRRTFFDGVPLRLKWLKLAKITTKDPHAL